ncbi:S8 family peptidase [Glaciihabitans sp. dw_435]|uniref:S8 family peptidase n=1 Tax=Glaciihabitans sp. dw_435 TaxID=2720081 RepID=UPI001BD3F1F1|nr:S8 family peptidase [Glaciihabitans sp. dw_435]
MTEHRRPLGTSALLKRLGARLASTLIASALVIAGALVPVSGAVAATTSPTSPSSALTNPYDDGHYIVTLRDAPVATYDGGVKSYAATRATPGKSLVTRSKKVSSYASYLSTEQKDVATDVGAKIVSSYTLATNGFTGTFTARQALELSRDNRVVSVVKDELLHVTAAEPSTDFLGLSGDDGLWASLGGVDAAGDGIVIGDIDTGIAPENPSFAGDPLGTVAGDAPYLDGSATVYNKSDGTQFRGVCTTGEQFTAADCSTKIIGTRYFIDNFGLDSIKGAADGEYVSPRDGAGHGSHTASTAAGNAGVSASVGGKKFGTISGVAPAAKLAIYKVCWTGIDGDGCSTGDLVAAIDAAVADGVDIINFSIGGGQAQSTVSVTDQAFLNAAAAGIFVSASAGNDGPKASTADNASPWITTVAASTIPSYDATVTAADGQTFLGGSITLPETGKISGKLVAGRLTGVAGATQPELCGTGTLDPAQVTGAIVLCERGVNDRVAKSAEVKRAGGIGMILVNPADDSIDLDEHSVPTIHLNADSFAKIREYAANPAARVTFENGNTSDKPDVATPQVAGFSSRGPILADGGDMLKPDIAAPGVAILADGPNAAGATPTYEFMSGTSMAAPHITGLAALYLSKDPLATPAEIKSAMMTTAYNTITAGGDPDEDPFAQGAGNVDPTKFLAPGLLYLNDIDDWKGYVESLGQIEFGVEPLDGTELNLASISIGSLAGTETVTRTVTSTQAGTFTAQPVTMAGVDVTVSPATMTFGAAGETKSYTVRFDRTDAAIDEFTTGYLRWTSGDVVVTSPLAVRPEMLSVPADVTGTGNTGSATIPVLAGETTDVDISSVGLAKGEVLRGVAHADGSTQSYVVDVPEGTTLTRIDLNTDDETADLDMHVYEIWPYGGTFLSNAAESGAADERVDMSNPDVAKYIIDVTAVSGTGDLGFSLSTYNLGASGAGDFAVDPSTLSMTLGDDASVSASWKGLDAGSSYLGKVSFGDSGQSTYVTVATTPLTQPATNTGDFVVTTDPGFVRAGHGVSLLARGLVPGEAYSMYLDKSTTSSITGFASTSGKVARYASLAPETTEGPHTITITTAGKSTSVTVIVAPITIGYVFPLIDAAYDGTPTVIVDTIYAGKGSLRVLLKSSTGKKYIDTTEAVDGGTIFDAMEYLSKRTALDDGTYSLRVWVVDEDGVQSQLHETSFDVGATTPSSTVLEQSVDDPNFVDMTFTNNTQYALYPTIEYKTCAGPVVFANIGVSPDVSFPATYDMHGITRATMTLDGKVVADYENASEGRCAPVAPKISQPFWITLSDAGDTGTPGSPITAVVSNRYASYSYGYTLRAGTGTEVLKDQFSTEGIPVTYVTKEGPVVDRTFAFKEKQDYWMAAIFEDFKPGKQASKIYRSFALPTTVADLAPVNAPPTEEPTAPPTTPPTNDPTTPPTDDPTTPPTTPPTGLPAKAFHVTTTAGLHVQGSTITVTGTGLAPKEHFYVRLQGTTVYTGVANSKGVATARVAIGSTIIEGKKALLLVGSTSKRTGATTTYVVAKSKAVQVGVSRSSVASGSTFTVAVKNLAPGEPLVVLVGGKRVSIASAHASGSGSYSVKVKAPSSRGTLSVVVRGMAPARTGHAVITVVRHR